MKHALGFGVLVVLIALVPNACGGGAAGGSEHQQAEGRPLPKYDQASLPAGRYHTTEFEPSFSFRIPGNGWKFEGPSGALGDPEHPDYLFFEKVPEAEIAFFNLRKLKGVLKPRGPTGAVEPMPATDQLVEWFQHHPYLKTSEPEPATVGGAKGVQFDVVLANLPENHEGLCGKTAHCLDIFALSTGGSSEIYYLKRDHYIVLEDVKGVSVVIYYSDLKDHFDKFEPVVEKVLRSVEWTDT
jgi:hypothetical protein